MDKILLEESTKQFSELLFQIIKQLGGTLWGAIREKEKNIENYLYKISVSYVQRFYERNGYIQILGMPCSIWDLRFGVIASMN